MSPRGQRTQPPKPVLRQDGLGYIPLNALSVSYLANGHGDAILRFHDEDYHSRLTGAPASQMAFTLDKNGKKRTLDLTGQIFNGLADALYRGKLPEVILAFPAPGALEEFVDTLTHYIEQLLSLGFFVPQWEQSGIGRQTGVASGKPAGNVVSTVIPCFVLAGDGLMYTRILTDLSHYLDLMSEPYPILDAAMRSRILGRFLRAVPEWENTPTGIQAQSFDWNEEDWAALASPLGSNFSGQPVDEKPSRDGTPNPATSILSGSHLRVEERPIATGFRVAGSTQSAIERVQSVFKAHSLQAVSQRSAVPNPIERLELEQTWQRLSQVILPKLALQNEWQPAHLSELMTRVYAGLLSIGHERKAFTSNEELGNLPIPGKGKNPKAEKLSTKTKGKRGESVSVAAIAKKNASNMSVDQEAYRLLNDLAQYASMLPTTEGSQDSRSIFRELAAQL